MTSVECGPENEIRCVVFDTTGAVSAPFHRTHRIQLASAATLSFIYEDQGVATSCKLARAAGPTPGCSCALTVTDCAVITLTTGAHFKIYNVASQMAS